MEQYDIDGDEIFEIHEALDKACQKLGKDISAEVQTMRSDKAAGSGATSPTKRSLSRSPSKSALRGSSAALLQTPQKRKVAFASGRFEHDPMVVDGTPAKKPRTSPRKIVDDLDRNAFSAFQAELCTPKRPSGGLESALQASSSQLTLDLLNSAADGDGDEDASGVDDDGAVYNSAEDVLPGPIDVPTTDVEMADASEADEPSLAHEELPPMTPRKLGRIPGPVFHASPMTPATARTTTTVSPRSTESPAAPTTPSTRPSGPALTHHPSAPIPAKASSSAAPAPAAT